MLALRFYIDKKDGLEHSRVIDVGPLVENLKPGDLDQNAARPKVEKLLKKGEQINSVVTITITEPDSHPVA